MTGGNHYEDHSFYPLIVSPKAAEVIELMEAMGFEHAHTKTGINEDITSVDLKHPDGFRVDVAQVDQMSQDRTAIRMNVRDFYEAYAFLTAHGFKRLYSQAFKQSVQVRNGNHRHS